MNISKEYSNVNKHCLMMIILIMLNSYDKHFFKLKLGVTAGWQEVYAGVFSKQGANM